MVEELTNAEETESPTISRRRALKTIGSGAVVTAGFSSVGAAASYEGDFDFHLYLRNGSNYEYEMADNEIRWALWDAFDHLYQESQDYDTPYQSINIHLHDDVNVELDDSGEASDFYDNSDGVLEQWHDNFDGYTSADKGNHLLLDERHEYSDAARVTEIGSNYEPAFEQPRSAVIGVGGNTEIAKGLAVMEPLHNLIDSESVTEVKDMINSGGHMHEHDLGTIRYGPDFDGEVTPMACLYTGGEGSEVWEKYNDGDDVTYHVEHGDCSTDRDYWNGTYTVIPSGCTVDAVKYTRDALYNL